MLGAVPFEQRGIAPASDDVEVRALAALVNCRFDIDGSGDFHAAIFHRHRQPFSLERAGDQSTRIIGIVRQSFLAKEPLLFRDGDAHLVADMVVAVGDQNGLVECAHSCSRFLLTPPQRGVAALSCSARWIEIGPKALGKPRRSDARYVSNWGWLAAQSF